MTKDDYPSKPVSLLEAFGFSPAQWEEILTSGLPGEVRNSDGELIGSFFVGGDNKK